MASMKLQDIAYRQRTYLVRDILFAVLVAIILAVQVSAFTSARPSFSGKATKVHVTQNSDDRNMLLRPGISVATSAPRCTSTLC